MSASLTSSTFWILTALAGRRRHGYDILRETIDASGGRVTLRVATLYAALERLEREGLVATDGEEIVNGRARRYYTLTERGTTSLTAEVEALESRARVARTRLAEVGPGFAPGRPVLS